MRPRPQQPSHVADVQQADGLSTEQEIKVAPNGLMRCPQFGRYEGRSGVLLGQMISPFCPVANIEPRPRYVQNAGAAGHLWLGENRARDAVRTNFPWYSWRRLNVAL